MRMTRIAVMALISVAYGKGMDWYGITKKETQPQQLLQTYDQRATNDLLDILNGNHTGGPMASSFIAQIKKGANPNIRNRVGDQPLIFAIRLGDKKLVSFLLDNGARVNAAGAGGQTPLMVATLRFNPKIAKILLDAGANPTLKDAQSKTALDYANEVRHPELIKLLAPAQQLP